MTAGSVGASAAPSRPLVIHEKPSSQCAAAATSAAVANVPSTPSETIGTSATRAWCQPIRMPPSSRITIKARTPIRSTVTNEIASPKLGTMSDTAAAASRKSAALGIANRSVSVRPKRASMNPDATTRMISPKSAISFMGGIYGWPDGDGRTYTFLTWT